MTLLRKALQRDLDKMDHWEFSNDVKFSKDKCWVLQLGQSNDGHRYRLGDKCLESSSAERNLGMLVSSRFNMIQKCAYYGKLNFGVHRRQHSQPVKRNDSILSTGAALPSVV